MPSCLAIIPARGGSKGLPRKNVRPLAGRPLISYAIEAAKAARRVTRVVVSTDDAEIASCSREVGAEVIDRPAELSGDSATSESAVVHALEELQQRESYQPDLVMLIQCTSPLTTSEDLDGLVEHLVKHDLGSTFTASPFFHFLWERDETSKARGINHAGRKRARRQDLAPQFLETGAAYLMRTEEFLATQERFCGIVDFLEVPAERTLEIDDPDDFARAEAVLLSSSRTRRSTSLTSDVRLIVFDFDGVFTDNNVLVMDDGHEAVFCSRGDGMGIEQLQKRTELELMILSKERNPVVSKRAEKLKLPCVQATDDKLSFLKGLLEQRGLSPTQVVYVGNDINDVECMRFVGTAVCPSDAHPDAKNAATIVLRALGGRGAVRELADLILAGK